MSFRWIVSQIGARQHFGVPRGFLHKDELRLLYTEAWCRHGRSVLCHGPKIIRAFAGRYHPDIPNSKVVSFNLGTLYNRARFTNRNTDVVAEHMHYLRFGKWFSTRVANDLSRRELNPEQDMFFGFNTGCLETIQMLSERRIFTVCDQIDPARVEEQLIYDEAERWPGWQKLPGRIPAAYWERMNAEWAAASMVLVNSDWSRKALIKQGVPSAKIAVIPISYEPEKLRLPARRNMDKPITVLWLGLVNLRKGIQYLIEAARLLQHNPRIRFVIAGPILIAEHAVKSAPPNMQFLGKITRTETGPLYRSADVFVLPTLSDGFAVSQLEAMSQALPVIATTNCGEVVTPGVDGLIVPAYDASALAEAIQKLDDDRNLLREMSYRALDKSTHFYLPRQVDRLEEAVIDFRKGRALDATSYRVVPEHSFIRLNSVSTQSNPPSLRVAVIQDGARLHYAVPLALQKAGVLRVMFSEAFFPRGMTSNLIRRFAGQLASSQVRAMLQRRADEIPPEFVRTNFFLTARQRLSRRRYNSDESFYQWSSRAAGDWVLRQGIKDSNALFGFVRNIDPRICREFRNRGVLTIGDQMIAPAAVEAAEAAIQNERWPDWKQTGREADYKLVQQVEQATWEELDRITCGSEYVRAGLVAQGIAASKINVIPYPIDAAKYPTSLDQPPSPSNHPLTIGFVGTVGLRKGAPYFLEVAKRLKGPRFRFVMVGPIQLPDPIKKMMSESIELVGRVPRAQTVDWMLKFDVFLFPSTCEGNAGSVTEAMATGLPIITSPNSGTPVQDNLHGFLRNYTDIDGMIACLETLAANPNQRRDMANASRSLAQTLTLENYGKQLVQAMTSTHTPSA
jgi:glycosyltransferase involved in cell wall biosynthesis